MNFKNYNNLIMVIFFIVYAIIALLNFQNNYTFITSFIFTLIALILVCYMDKKNYKENTETNFNSYPLTNINYTYLVLQIIISLIIIFTQLNLNISIIIQIIIIAAYIIIALGLYSSKNYIENQETEDKINTQFHKDLTTNIDLIINQNNNPEYNEQLKQLKDSIRYSNPTDNNKVKETNQEIVENTKILQQATKNNDSQTVEKSINTLTDLIKQRDTLLKP